MITIQDVRDCKSGNNDLIIVQLFPNPEPADKHVPEHLLKCYDWCRENIGPGGINWATDGVTVFSYRIIFVKREDAIVFKLTFGL